MDQFTVIRLLGEGSFGKVWLCSQKGAVDDVQLAVKVVNSKRSQSWEECLKLREIRSLQKLGKHPNIVCLRQVIRSKTKANQLNLVFDYHPSNVHKELQSARRSEKYLGEDRKSLWTYQLLSAVSHAHKNGFFHRDIKPENILVDRTGSLQLCDFGLAREIRSTPPYTPYVSTRWYRAPELILRASKYNSPVDIWAVACVIVELSTLRPLFPAKDTIDHLYQICAMFGPIDTDTWGEGVVLAKRMDKFKAVNGVIRRSLASVLPASSSNFLALVMPMFALDPDKRVSAAHCLTSDMFHRFRSQPAPMSQIDEDKEEEECEDNDASVSEPPAPRSTRPGMSQRTNSERLEQLTKEVDMLLSYEQQYGHLEQQDNERSKDVRSGHIAPPTTKLSQDTSDGYALNGVSIVKDVDLQPPPAPLLQQVPTEITDTTRFNTVALGSSPDEQHTKAFDKDYRFLESRVVALEKEVAFLRKENAALKQELGKDCL